MPVLPRQATKIVESLFRPFRYGALLAALALPSAAHGQVYDLQRLEDAIVINVTDARPLSAALQLLSEQHPLDMTYEDPRYIYDDDIQDVTLSVRADLDRFDDPSEAPRVLVPRARTLSAYLPISRNSAAAEDWNGAILSLVEVQNRSGSAGQFRVDETDGVIHVVPVASRDARGRFTDQPAILDTRVSIEPQELDGLSMLSVICEAISVAAGGTYSHDPETMLQNLLKPLRVPMGSLASYRGTLEATDEPARNVIMRLLKDVNGTLIWQVFVTYDPVNKNYWINIRSIIGQQSQTPLAGPPSSIPIFSVPESDRVRILQQPSE